jgi:hypothetical protein
MRCDSFGRSLVFAAVAGLGCAVWMGVAGPLCGGGFAAATYLVGAVAAYLAGLAGGARRRLLAAVLGMTAGGAVLMTAPGFPALSLGLVVVLAAGRSVFLLRGTAARAVLVETGLGLGGLTFAWAMAAPTVGGVMLAVWSFFLVQSLFFLVGHPRTRPATHPGCDPFDTAHARALVLLDGGLR